MAALCKPANRRQILDDDIHPGTVIHAPFEHECVEAMIISEPYESVLYPKVRKVRLILVGKGAPKGVMETNTRQIAQQHIPVT